MSGHLTSKVTFIPLRMYKDVLPSDCSNLTYAERRCKLCLPTLELRRMYNDLIMCYKIVFGIVRMEIGDFFTFNTNISTRGHPYKL